MKSLKAVALIICILYLFSSCNKDDDKSLQAPPVEEVYETVINPQEDRYELFTGLITVMDSASAIDSVLTVFLQDPNVSWAVAGRQGIAVQYKNGIRGGLFVNPLDYPEITDIELMQSTKNINNPVDIKNIEKTIPGSKKAIFLNPIYSENTDYSDAMIENYYECLPKIGFEPMVIIKDHEASLDKYKSLSDYGIIHISSHGMAWPEEENITDIYLLTGQSFTETFYNEYKAKIMEKDIIILDGEDGSVIFIRPDFIIENNNFRDTDQLFYGEFCYSGLGNWPELLNSAGVSGYFGYDWSVLARASAYWNIELIDYLTNTNVTIAHSTYDWMNNDLYKFYWDEFSNRNVHIIYEGLTDLSLFDENDIEHNYTKCILGFRVNADYDYYSESYGTDTSYSYLSRFLVEEAEYTGSLSGNTFTGTYDWHDDDIGTYDWDIAVTLSASGDEVTSLVVSNAFVSAHDNSEWDLTAASIPFSGDNEKYEITGTETCNSVTSFTSFLEYNGMPLLEIYNTTTVTGHECDQDSHIRIEFE
jgi:hypothetical protein